MSRGRILKLSLLIILLGITCLNLYHIYCAKSALHDLYSSLNGSSVSSFKTTGELAEEFEQMAAQLTPEEKAELQRVLHAWTEYKKHRFYKKSNDADMVNGAVDGLMAGTGDKHAYYISKDTMRERQTGKIAGIGAGLRYDDGYPIVIEVMPKSPASRAGVEPFERIIEVDGEPTKCEPLSFVVGRIRGPVGSSVKLKLKSAVSGRERELVIVRAEVTSEPFSYHMKIVGNKSVIMMRLDEFSDRLAILDGTPWRIEAINVALKKPDALILDLRGNPGGAMALAVAMAGSWIGTAKVTTMEYGDGRKPKVLTAKAEDAPFQGLPTVILVDEGSASASEVLSAALRDYGVAVLVGQKTYGKGTGQQVRSLDDGAAIVFTEFQWLSPKGQAVEDKGLIPDVIVPEQTVADIIAGKDAAMDKAMEIIQKQWRARGEGQPAEAPAPSKHKR